MIESCLKKGFHVIGALKSNRLINPFGFKVKLSQLADSIDPNTLDVVTVKGKSYRVYRYEGPVGSLANAVVLICYEINGEDIESLVYLLSTDINLDTNKIIEYYLLRWKIETNYKYLKSNLSFDKYRVRSILSIERYFLIIFFVINFLELFRFKSNKLSIKTIGDTINYFNRLSVKELICFVYKSSKANIPLKDIFEVLKIAS